MVPPKLREKHPINKQVGRNPHKSPPSRHFWGPNWATRTRTPKKPLPHAPGARWPSPPPARKRPPAAPPAAGSRGPAPRRPTQLVDAVDAVDARR